MSMKDIRLKRRPNNNISHRSNRTVTDFKEKNNSNKNISTKKSITNVSVISDYSTHKSKITNIEVLFKNNNYTNSTYTSKKNIKQKNEENNTNNYTWKNSGYYRKYKNKK